MPKVPDIDPSVLESMTGGQVQPSPEHLLMAAMDMHDHGRLIDKGATSSMNPNKSLKLPGKPANVPHPRNSSRGRRK